MAAEAAAHHWVHSAPAGLNLGLMSICQADRPVFVPVPPRRLAKHRPLNFRKLSMKLPSIFQSRQCFYPQCQFPVSSCTQEPDTAEPPGPPMSLLMDKAIRPGTPGTGVAEELPVAVSQQLVLARSVKNMILKNLKHVAVCSKGIRLLWLRFSGRAQRYSYTGPQFIFKMSRFNVKWNPNVGLEINSANWWDLFRFVFRSV